MSLMYGKHHICTFFVTNATHRNRRPYIDDSIMSKFDLYENKLYNIINKYMSKYDPDIIYDTDLSSCDDTYIDSNFII